MRAAVDDLREDPDETDNLHICSTIAVNDELFGVSQLNSEFPFETDNSFVLQSKGFRSDRGELLWRQEAAFEEDFSILCTIQI